MKNLILLISFLTLVLQVSVAQQYTKTWTGAAGDNNYYNDANWDPSGEPGYNDVVVIPSGTSECVIGPTFFGAGLSELHNFGELTLNNVRMEIDKLHNTNQINVNGEATIFNNSEGGVFNNQGNIDGSTQDSDLNIHQFNQINNSGQLNIDGCQMIGNNINNTGDILAGDNGLNITTGSLYNNGTIFTAEDPTSVGSVKIEANTVTNDGIIKTGDSEGMNGGSIEITADKLFNNKGKYIVSGNGETPDKNGKVILNCERIDNKGIIKAGYSSGYKDRFETYFNEVAMYADSIFMEGDSVKIEADTMRFVFDYMKLSDITEYGSLYADVWIEFLATENGVLDLSEGLGQYIMSCGNYNGIHFYCNNIIPPAQGMNYICDVPANVHPADTTIIQASISSEYVYDDAGHSGAFYVHLKNLGTGSRAFDYSISSINGWAIETSGSTQTLTPFQKDSILINYTIPEGAFSQTDTLTVSLSSGDFSISAQSYIHSNPDSTTAIFEPENSTNGFVNVFPNPFRESTNISYTLQSKGIVRFEVYNMNGHQVYSNKLGVQSPGLKQFGWDAHGNQGQKLNSGIYFYKILSNTKPQYSGKLIIE